MMLEILLKFDVGVCSDAVFKIDLNVVGILWSNKYAYSFNSEPSNFGVDVTDVLAVTKTLLECRSARHKCYSWQDVIVLAPGFSPSTCPGLQGSEMVTLQSSQRAQQVPISCCTSARAVLSYYGRTSMTQHLSSSRLRTAHSLQLRSYLQLLLYSRALCTTTPQAG